MKQIGLFTTLAIMLSGCNISKPEHYYVLCEGQDGNGWSLVSIYKDEDGYLLSCTYQSPDKEKTYTHSCNVNGCD